MLELGRGLDLGEEAFAAEHGAEFGPEDLEGDGAIVLDVVGEIDRRHAAGTELTLQAVAVGEGGGQPLKVSATEGVPDGR